MNENDDDVDDVDISTLIIQSININGFDKLYVRPPPGCVYQERTRRMTSTF